MAGGGGRHGLRAGVQALHRLDLDQLPPALQPPGHRQPDVQRRLRRAGEGAEDGLRRIALDDGVPDPRQGLRHRRRRADRGLDPGAAQRHPLGPGRRRLLHQRRLHDGVPHPGGNHGLQRGRDQRGQPGLPRLRAPRQSGLRHGKGGRPRRRHLLQLRRRMDAHRKRDCLQRRIRREQRFGLDRRRRPVRHHESACQLVVHLGNVLRGAVRRDRHPCEGKQLGADGGRRHRFHHRQRRLRRRPHRAQPGNDNRILVPGRGHRPADGDRDGQEGLRRRARRLEQLSHRPKQQRQHPRLLLQGRRDGRVPRRERGVRRRTGRPERHQRHHIRQLRHGGRDREPRNRHRRRRRQRLPRRRVGSREQGDDNGLLRHRRRRRRRQEHRRGRPGGGERLRGDHHGQLLPGQADRRHRDRHGQHRRPRRLQQPERSPTPTGTPPPRASPPPAQARARRPASSRRPPPRRASTPAGT